jgi:hypothetical protein
MSMPMSMSMPRRSGLINRAGLGKVLQMVTRSKAARELGWCGCLAVATTAIKKSPNIGEGSRTSYAAIVQPTAPSAAGEHM